MICDIIPAGGVKYLFASCRPLYSGHFAAVSAAAPAEWLAVGSPAELEAALAKHTPLYIFFVHWNWKVPPEIYTRHECVCFHMTDVPYGRGGSPLQNLILRGHSHTVVTALRMVAELDAGPVYCKRPLSLAGRAEDIYLRAGGVCVDIMRWMLAEQPAPVEQAGTPVMFARRKPEQSALPEEGTPAQLYDFIRMLDAPEYPPAFILYGAFRLEFAHAQLGDGELMAQVVIRPNPDLEISS
jgi:methionyl-tRNA formyltransferase